MTVLGALASSTSASTVYFCTVSENELPDESLRKLQEQSGVQIDVSKSKICCIAVESEDGLQNDKRLVGLIFEDAEYYRTIALKNHTNLDMYFRDILEE